MDTFLKIVLIELAVVILLLLWILCRQSVADKVLVRRRKAIWTFLCRIVGGLLFYLLWLVPRNKNLVIFGAEDGNGFSGNPKYLFLEAKKHPELRCVWITKSKNILNRMRAEGYEVYLANSGKGLRVQLRAGTVILSHSLKDDMVFWAAGGATVINTWHGVGLKRSWFRNTNAFAGQWMHAAPSLRRSYHLWWAHTNMGRHNYVIGTSEEVNDYYPATYDVPADHILNLGQARNDVLFEEDPKDARLPSVFLKNKKIIVYMPTHRGYGERKKIAEHVGENINYRKVSKVLEKYGYTLVIKQHRFNMHQSATRQKFSNIVDISALDYEVDTQLILKHTDILITDYSSVYTDFLLLDRPVVFYCYDMDEYLSQWELNFDYDYVTPGPKAFTSDELIAELEKLMRGEDHYEAERQRVKRVFYSPENQTPVAKKQMDYIVEHIIRPKK